MIGVTPKIIDDQIYAPTIIYHVTMTSKNNEFQNTASTASDWPVCISRDSKCHAILPAGKIPVL